MYYISYTVVADPIYNAVFSHNDGLALYEMRFSVAERTVVSIALHKEAQMQNVKYTGSIQNKLVFIKVCI